MFQSPFQRGSVVISNERLAREMLAAEEHLLHALPVVLSQPSLNNI
jgi:hypothetical protein